MASNSDSSRSGGQDGSGEGDFEFGDGVITRIQTFQKYFTQTELRLYIEKTLGMEAVPAAPGVFYVYQDDGLRESFAASKYRRRPIAPRRRVSEIQFDRYRNLLEALITVSSELGRLSFEDEFERTREIIATFGSMKQAYKLHPHPPIRRTIKLSLRNLFLQCIDHSDNKNPLLLDQKEKMIESDHP